jgi:glycosyltransferase involved in cell wall biosynthesis
MHGGVLVMFRYAGYLVQQGHEVEIVSPEEPVECLVPDGVRLRLHKALPSRLVFYTFKLVYLWQLARVLRSGFDVVIPIHTPLVVHAVFARWRYGLNFRIVLLYQDFLAMPRLGGYLRFILRQNWIRRNLDSVIAVSMGSAREFQSASQIPCRTIPNGIDELFFEQQPTAKGRYVLFVGRPGPSKGFDVFEKAMELVVKECPDVKGVLVSTEVSNGMLGRIQTVRFQNREQLRQLYSEALVYAHASIGESFGLPPLEAMAAGTASVVTRTVGTDDYARDNHNCLAIDYGDYKALAQHTIRLIRDNDLRGRLEKTGRLTALSYQWTNSLRRFEEEVTKSIHKRRGLCEPLVGLGSEGLS